MTQNLSGIDPLRMVARVTIETTSPMLIGDGTESKEADQTFVRDVHGLPMIPGTSLAGILAHRFRETGLKDLHELVFGRGADPSRNVESIGARLRVSDAYFHNADDRPVDQTPGTLTDDLTKDEVLTVGERGVHRDRVRIGARGTADGRGKFDALHCPKGARFTFEMELGWGSASAGATDAETNAVQDDKSGREVWTTLLGLLKGRATRLGRSTRSGLGGFETRRVIEGAHWLPKDEEWNGLKRPDFATHRLDAYLNLPTDLGEAGSLNAMEIECNDANITQIALEDLKPVSTWLFGGGDPVGDEDIAPVAEPIIAWNTGKNRPGYVVDAMPVAPGSSIKGAIAHRTAWHLNRLRGDWLDNRSGEAEAIRADYVALFGDVKSDASNGEDTATAGALFFDDIYVAKPSDPQFTHNVIDRFTSGVRAGLLYQERTRMGGDFPAATIGIDTERTVDASVRKALRAALDDLCRGWLALGGGTGRGHGAFRAKLNLGDASDWFENNRTEDAA